MMKVYGAKVSYYTGKLEAYLRYKGVPYQSLSPYPHESEIRKNVGALQMPIVERADGRWMSDTTPIILQLEREHSTPTVLPPTRTVRFIALLMEDYADEWLWRPAMHYRWSHRRDRELLSRIIAEDVVSVPLPRFLIRRIVKLRQLRGFVKGDGVRASTRKHVEAGYVAALDNMSEMLAERPYLLGDAPSIADFGFMGPMFRHFGQDPTPSEIMRERAPAVYAWVARMWNVRASLGGPNFVKEISPGASPMLKEICETHLGQLAANAIAYSLGPRRFDMKIQECDYSRMPVSRYRVACLERLREAFVELADADQRMVRALLPYPEASILWSSEIPASSGYDPERLAPFGKAVNVYAMGVPR